MSDEKLYLELEELCNYSSEEMQRTLDTLQNMLNHRKLFEFEEDEEENQ